MQSTAVITPSTLSVNDLPWQIEWDKNTCTLCGRCTSVCPVSAIELGVFRKRAVEATLALQKKPTNSYSIYYGIRQRTDPAYRCIGCGMCSQACPWNMPRVDTETGVSTKCISCGRCAEQCPNGAIQFIDWQDIAQKIIDEGIVRTTTAVTA